VPGAGSGGLTNNGVLEAINGGTLLLSANINGGPGGQIAAGVGSSVVQNGVTISGVINTSGSGVFAAAASGSNILSGVTLNGTVDLTQIGNSRERIEGLGIGRQEVHRFVLLVDAEHQEPRHAAEAFQSQRHGGRQFVAAPDADRLDAARGGVLGADRGPIELLNGSGLPIEQAPGHFPGAQCVATDGPAHVRRARGDETRNRCRVGGGLRCGFRHDEPCPSGRCDRERSPDAETSTGKISSSSATGGEGRLFRR